jgi:hypothetical protein
VGVQWPLKQVIGCALSGAVIKEVSEQIARRSDPSSIKLDTRLPMLWNHSTGALIRAHKALNIEHLVKKVSLSSTILISCIQQSLLSPPIKSFELCQAGTFNLSQESLTSLSMLMTLMELHVSNTKFYAKLSKPQHSATADPKRPHRAKLLEASSSIVNSPLPSTASSSNKPPFTNRVEDDGSIPTSDIIDHICSGRAAVKNYTKMDSALFTSKCDAESLEEDFEANDGENGHGECGSDWESGESGESDQDSSPDFEPEVNNHLSEEGDNFQCRSSRKAVNLHDRYMLWVKD